MRMKIIDSHLHLFSNRSGWAEKFREQKKALKEQSKKCKVSKSNSKKKECVTPEWFNENIKV